jgi:hypothetical protein
MKLPLTGGCLCGAIRYEVTQPPLKVYACHCLDCQRITSSAFSIGVTIPGEAFRQTGKEAVGLPGGITASGRVKTRWVCPDCGTTLYGGPRLGTEPPGYNRTIRGGTLDDTSWLKPTMHFWTRSKQPWVVMPDGDACYDTQPGA